MSLRAKIEAIIYAAEEPVTLVQLATLLAEDAEAELVSAHTAQAELVMGAEPSLVSEEPLALHEVTTSLQQGEQLTLPDEKQAAATDKAAPSSEESVAAPASTEAPLMADAEAAAKKAAKDRERQVRDVVRRQVDALIEDYGAGERGMEIREVAGGYRMGTKPEYHDAVRSFVKSLKPPMKLTLQALETLAVVAYKQPVTAPEISEIRGVDSGGVLGSLISRKLITTAGRKQVIGRPILYKTTKEFLLRFGLKDIGELPSMEEFEKMAGELAEQDGLPLTDDAASEAMHSQTAVLDEPLEDAAAAVLAPEVVEQALSHEQAHDANEAAPEGGDDAR